MTILLLNLFVTLTPKVRNTTDPLSGQFAGNTSVLLTSVVGWDRLKNDTEELRAETGKRIENLPLFTVSLQGKHLICTAFSSQTTSGNLDRNKKQRHKNPEDS